MVRMWQSPFVWLAAYYVVLSLAVGLLVRAFPQIVDLKDALPGPLLDAVKARGTPHVIAAEYRSLRGLGND